MKKIIVLQSDFSLTWSAVSSMKGIIRKVDTEVEIQDGTHEIEPFNIWMGAQELQTLERCWPDGTIYVSVVDPGVGSQRIPCVCCLDNGSFIVTPDNGTLSLLKKAGRIREVRKINEAVNRYRELEDSAVFDGRDLFAYTAARLSAGIIDFAGVGDSYPVEEIQECPESVFRNTLNTHYAEGFVSHTLPWYGGLRASVTNREFIEICGFHIGDMIHTEILYEDQLIFSGEVPFVRSFSDVEKGKPLLYQGSSLLVSLDLNEDNFVRKYDIHAGIAWKIVFSK